MRTQEIGSLAKPNWRVKLLRGQGLNEDDLKELKYWHDFLGVDFDHEMLKKWSTKDIVEHSALLAIRLLESTGLDTVFDGEQFRSEMYEYPVNHISGFEFKGIVRSFDNKYYKKASCIGKPSLVKPYHVEEFAFTRRNTGKEIKVPITGPYTLAEWSYDEYYIRKYLSPGQNYRDAKLKAKEEFVIDLAKHIIRPNLETLIEAGAKYIQVDEPALTAKPNEVPIFVDAFNKMVSGLTNGCKFSLHICYGDYSALFPKILELKGCSQLALEFANRNYGDEFGRDILELFREYSYDWELGLGVVDVHSDDVESPELVRRRITYASKFLDPDKIYVNPDCGLRTRTWNIAYLKLRNMVMGTELTRKELS